MKNPDKYIRAAYISAISNATGLPVYDAGIPISVEDLPDKYYLIGTQTKAPRAESKYGWEWSCTVEVHCVFVNAKGYNSGSAVDDMEEAVLSTGMSLVVPEFRSIQTDFIDSIRLDMETQTNTINRKIVVYQHWLNMEK